MSRRLTASGLPRALRCPASIVLPAGEDVQGPWAQRGDALHLASEGKLDEVPEKHRAEAEQLDTEALDALSPPGTRKEVPFSYDPATGEGRELEVNGRDYDAAGLGIFEIPGRSDLWGPGYVGDEKSGWRDVDSATENAQLLVAAAANAQVYGVDKVHLRVIDIRDPSSPRVQSQGDVDSFDLEIFRSRLERLHEDAADMRARHERGETIEVNEGPWCRWCDCLLTCPAKTQLMEQAVDGRLDNEVSITWAGQLTERSAPVAYRQYQAVQMLAKRMSQILYAHASKNPIDLGNGRVFGQRTKMGNESLDGQTAWEVIKEAYGLDAAEKAVGFTTSKKAIKQALREVAGKGELSKRNDEVLEAIRERGGSERKEKTAVEEYKKDVA